MMRPSDISFLYQYVGGGIIFLTGLICLIKSGALRPGHPVAKRWLFISLGVMLFYLLLQGLFQFVLSNL